MNNEIKNTQNTEKTEDVKTPETPKKTGITLWDLMLEDFRHRRWMLVLSAIAQFFCGPFITLFVLSRYEPRYNMNLTHAELVNQVLDSAKTLCSYLSVFALIVAAVGALIVGFGGFRHLFNKRMTDMMNSVPVKRGKMFAVIYLNGLLMWVVPFLFFGGISFIEIAAKLGEYGIMPKVFGLFLLTLLGAAFAFFCIYNLVVLCTAISGTIFNAIVNFICLGFGASAFYMILYYMSEAYFQNFWRLAIDYLDISWISAPISGCAFGFLICARESFVDVFSTPLHMICLILTAAVCIVNLIIGYRIYVTRKSEEAENGTSGKIYKFVLRFVSSILAGLYTSYWVNQIVGYSGSYGWCVFIAAFFSAFAFGVMDIIQKKSFRAFFAHRGQMILSVAATLIILAVFIFDVINFDNHIVPGNNIASATVCMRINNYYWGDYGTGFKPVEGMPGCITWDDDTYNDIYSGEVEIPAELAEKIMRAEKVYSREYDSDYSTSAYEYDPVTGVESSLPLDEWSMYSDFAFVYFNVDRDTGLDFLRSYRIADKDILEEISKTEGYKELNYPLNCGAFGYPETVKIMDDYGNPVYTLTGSEMEKLMSVYYDEFNKNFDLYGVNYLDQRYYAVQIMCSYEMIYNQYSSGSHYFYIVVGEKDTATVRMIERLTGMPVDTFMDDEDLYYYG